VFCQEGEKLSVGKTGKIGGSGPEWCVWFYLVYCHMQADGL